MGCTAFPGAIPATLDEGVSGPGFPVEVFNVLGAGDAFMSGFLRGWLRDLPLTECCRLANACGAFAVSRHGCAPAIPSWVELEGFLASGSEHHRLREDARLEQVHWATNRDREWPQVLAFAFDHRAQFEELCQRVGASPERIPQFKRLALSAAMMTADGRSDGGILLEAASAWRHSTRPPARACGSAARSRCRARARCASRVGPTSAAACGPGRPSTASSAWCSTTPTIRPSCAPSRSVRC